MIKLKIDNEKANLTRNGIARRVPRPTSPIPKGVAKKIPPQRINRNNRKMVHKVANHDVYVPPRRRTSGHSALKNASSSFDAAASGGVYELEPGLGPDANGEIEFRTGNTPAGLFSPVEGESSDMPCSPEHIFKDSVNPKSAGTPPEREFGTPEPRGLESLFSPDAPRGMLSKKVLTYFVSDYGENVPESAQEDNYIGRSVTAVVVKTFVPCFIVQMPKKIRARIYSLVLFPYGKAKAPRPFFSAKCSFRIPPPALLQLNKQIRNEASRIYLGNMLVSGYALEHVVPWLQLLEPTRRAMIGKIKLPFDPWNHVDKTREQQIRLQLRELREHGIEVKRARFDLIVQPADRTRSLGGDLTDEE